MKIAVLALLMLFLTGCRKEVTIPEHLLGKDEMINVLLDLHIAEAEIVSLRVKRDSSEIYFREAEKVIFEKFGIPDSIFKESYEFYLENPEFLEEVYSAVVDSLSLKEKLAAPN